MIIPQGGISSRLDTVDGEGNGTPLQYSCLENPIDGGAWQAAVHGVMKSQTRLSNFTFTFMHWRKKWQPTLVFLPEESQGRESLVGCHLWGRTELDTTEVTQQLHCGYKSLIGYLMFKYFLPSYEFSFLRLDSVL